MRAGFHWRRGLVLAGLRLLICIPLIVVEESHVWDWAGAQENWRPHRAPVVQPGEGETVSFSPCDLWSHMDLPQRIVVMGELPAAEVSGWGQFCPPVWTPAGWVGAGWPGRGSRRAAVESSIAMCGLIALQWILVGGFPLIHPRKWYWEPGALITICTCTGILASLAPFLWLGYFILLAVKLLQGGARGLLLTLRYLRYAGRPRTPTPES
jgi:hypothetical protein